MKLDLTNPEHGNRYEAREPGAGARLDAVGLDTDECWVDLVLVPGATSAPEPVDAPTDDAAPRKRRREPVVVPPTIARVYRDFDVHDLLNDVVAHQVRR